MSDWTEQWLRGAASWKAFKEGKMLVDAGAVTDAKKGSSGWQANVRVGKRTFRVRVKASSATNIETLCGCPENRATGALCAHGVAAGLAAIAGIPAKESKPNESAAPQSKSVDPAIRQKLPGGAGSAWQVVLPPTWREMLRRGRCAGSLHAAEGELSTADEKLSEWLFANGQTGKPPLHFNLAGNEAARFLELLPEHPRIVGGKEQTNLDCRSGALIPLGKVEREAEKVRIQASGAELFQVGEQWWRMEPNGFAQIGNGEPAEEMSKVMAALGAGRGVQIPIERFLDRLNDWQEWLQLPTGSWVEQLHFIPAAPQFELAIEGNLKRVEVELRVSYRGAALQEILLPSYPGLPVLEADRCEIRNWQSERKAVERLEKIGFAMAGARGILIGEASIQDFLFKHLGVLENDWKLVLGDRFQAAKKQIVFVEPNIEVLGSGEDWLSFDLRFETNDRSVISMGEIKRLLRGGNSGSGKRVVLSSEVEELINPLIEESDLRQEGGHFVAPARTGELILELRKNIDKSKNNIDLESYSQFESPRSLVASMRSYQSLGSGWLMDRLNRFGGGLLADDMGLGKTMQSIAVIEKLFQNNQSTGVVMVVATASLLGNWKAEFGKFAPNRVVRVLHGQGRESVQKQVADGEVILTSFGTLSRDLAWHLKRSYEAVIVDEASLMRNPDTDHAKALFKLDAKGRVALTGTPIENGIRDLWSIFRFVQPGWLGTREQFKERYEQPLAAGEGAAVMNRLKVKTAPFMLRRTKEEVAPELPSKIFVDEFCDLSSEQQAVYRDLLVEGRKRVEVTRDSGNAGAARMQVLTALLRLRQTCCDLSLLQNERFDRLNLGKRSAKLERLMELLDEAVSGNHKVLIFSQFQKQLLEIEKCLIERDIGCLRLDGQTRNRQQLVDRFQSADGPPVFLISLKAGGYGLNLTAADIVVHFDPWWNPAAEAQATDRAHRIGQTRPVTVYRMLTRGTVEEKVVRLQAKKKELAAAVDETGGGDASGWSDSELRNLLEI
ncbi:DEAD/DEAH box helicase [Luteolibacter pohnpeiensis]|uniref:DEAD/DEAH box helicase n=1 Tax=Luteolibacter pohnpeiensis TaxID=454153 RepID=A0A934SDJ5_9BACT|nr:DEAD/DEAH box helicase [Luteolibacter pohnpeiensis]MBK1884157.1 DEAD/DEAH box helicase [Luteolibacter pohnpeiensis]